MTIMEPIKQANGVVPEFKLCLCGRTALSHCESFVDKVWSGCLKEVDEDGNAVAQE